jgi:serine/threonine protein kinase
LGTLRDGDWRENKEEAQPMRMEIDANDESWVDDERLEGTPAYLPPEVIERKQAPSIYSDAWALACLTLFCLQGRPQYFGSAEDVLQQIHRDFEVLSGDHPATSIRFDEQQSASTSSSHHGHRLFDHIAALIGEDNVKPRARAFISSLMSLGRTSTILSNVRNHSRCGCI